MDFDISAQKILKKPLQMDLLWLSYAVKRTRWSYEFGRIDGFFDIYAERDLKAKAITETEIQEIIDDFDKTSYCSTSSNA